MTDPAEAVLTLLDVLDEAVASLRVAFMEDHAKVAERFPDEPVFGRGVEVGATLALDDLAHILDYARCSYLGLVDL